MKDYEQKKAAKEFAKYWKDKGDEKSESQPFWLSLLRDVFGKEHPEQWITFEDRVKLDNTSFIDGMISKTHVMIEQKSVNKSLNSPIKQSDGTKLTPFQQAKRYSSELPYSERPRWIVTCNFKTFHIYDMERPKGDPEVIELKNLPNEVYRLAFLTDTGNDRIKKETDVSVDAGVIVGDIYAALEARYTMTEDKEEILRSLNVLCVRLVFCFYAEDAGLFGKRGMFHDYLSNNDAKHLRSALISLFKVLNQPESERDDYLEEDLAAFPYVNGGLFADENIIIPQMTDEIRTLLLDKANDDFDWSVISPTVFGAVFESTLNPESRHEGGMHYTAIEDIHKVIDPLFLNDLHSEFEEIMDKKQVNVRNDALIAFQNKLASLRWLDPACGSGNFLTETFLSVRRLENKVIAAIYDLIQDQTVQQLMGDENVNPIKVSISQFYGIEINDFAVTVGKTALWIAESQMMKETESIINMNLNFLPLKTQANIVEGNALTMDWEEVAPRGELDYIMGNPPFLGYSNQSPAQKHDIKSVYVDEKGKPYKSTGKIDYVSGWYFKASQFIQNTSVHAAFVSTNSITQGDQVAPIWEPLFKRFGIHIDFAYRTFQWNNHTAKMAHVHCVIIGFSFEGVKHKYIFDGDLVKEAKNISPYLLDAPDIYLKSISKPLCGLPQMRNGNRPADGGHLIIEEKDYEAFVKAEPRAKKYIKKLLGAEEFINNKKRWCLWLVGVPPQELRKMPLVMKRIELCREDRVNAKDEGRRKLAMTPTLFRENYNPAQFIVIPRVSSEKRRYVPMGFLDSETIITDSVQFIPETSLYHFGVLTSNVHMAWMRAVCGRLKSDYRYSAKIVYNNFPWPTPTAEQKATIEKTAQAILDARKRYPDASLADLYDDLTMPPELRFAHQQNDRAVMNAYGYPRKDFSESDCVADLMRRYQKLTEKVPKK